MVYFEINRENGNQPAEAVIRCIEEDRKGILLDETHAPPEYFDLSSGLLGKLLHKLSSYRLPLALVVSQPEKYSKHFQSFLAEANRGNEIQSFATPEEAKLWLEKKRSS